ncbi:protein translocase SEC61 complex subunit gamma [Candidatus Woesearchaeota archaeon]|nr:protein translocase SEC61 complex subunit gamma [Candidatus Woesearchaeota archaeon]
MDGQTTSTGWQAYVVLFKSFIVECKRVLTVTKKPTGEEFKTVVKVAGAGMLFIGLIGFLVMLIVTLLKGTVMGG